MVSTRCRRKLRLVEISKSNLDSVDSTSPIADNTDWKGESRVLTILVSLTLLGAGDPGEQNRIDFLQKPNALSVTPGIPPTRGLQNRIHFEKSNAPLATQGVTVHRTVTLFLLSSRSP